MTSVRKWCFTLNNYSAEDELLLSTLYPDTVRYLIYGREVGENGTPHLQGFAWFNGRKSMRQAKMALGHRCHLEVCRGNPSQNRDYCSKDGDFEEFGQLTDDAGKRSDWDQYKEFLQGFDGWPTDFDIADRFPALFGRYNRGCREMRKLMCRQVPTVEGDLRDWQVDLVSRLAEPPDDRKIHFVVDYLGGLGKTWFQKKLLMEGSDVQVLPTGKRDDMCYAVEEGKLIYMINVARGQMEYLNYSFLEMLKDGIVHSPKYESCTKIIGPCHVVVFSNEMPDMHKLTEDRYVIIDLNHP